MLWLIKQWLKAPIEERDGAKIVPEPIFEADFEDNAYGYRPARGAADAVKDLHRHFSRGYTDVAMIWCT